MKVYSSELGQKVRNERKKRNLTQAQLAELLSISYQYLGNIENSKAMPSVHVLVSLANEFGVSIDYLLLDKLEDKQSVYEHEIMQMIKGHTESTLYRLRKFIEMFLETKE